MRLGEMLDSITGEQLHKAVFHRNFVGIPSVVDLDKKFSDTDTSEDYEYAISHAHFILLVKLAQEEYVDKFFTDKEENEQ